jgi:hypothetical protein
MSVTNQLFSVLGTLAEAHAQGAQNMSTTRMTEWRMTSSSFNSVHNDNKLAAVDTTWGRRNNLCVAFADTRDTMDEQKTVPASTLAPQKVEEKKILMILDGKHSTVPDPNFNFAIFTSAAFNMVNRATVFATPQEPFRKRKSQVKAKTISNSSNVIDLTSRRQPQ